MPASAMTLLPVLAAPARPLASMAIVAAATFVMRDLLGVSNHTTVALVYLLIVLFVAARTTLGSAVATSAASMLALNYFFMPPVGTLTIADPHNWVALVAFLVVGIVASHLATSARERAREALDRRNELARLFGVSRDVLLITDGDGVMRGLARHIAQRFELDTVTLYLDEAQGWEAYDGGPLERVVPGAVLDDALRSARGALHFDARTRSYAGQTVVAVGEVPIALAPVRIGTKVIGLLGVGGREVEAGTLDALAGMVAIAAERAQFLAERRAAELTRQRAELSSAVLASLSHDLRTPLTAIRIAVSNIQDTSLPAADRAVQATLAMAQLQHLTRLFDEILDMARIEADAVQAKRQWVGAADVVDAALASLPVALGSREVRVRADADHLVEVDPQLTSAALTHLVENAAQYSPDDAPIDIDALVTTEGLRVAVTDRGPGLEPNELDRLFEPLFRGARARQIASGTGMGLAITRGLLAAEGGRVWAENAASGGARFTIDVPGRVRRAGVSEADA